MAKFLAMAATNLAVVTENEIVIYDDAVYRTADVIERIPLGRSAHGTDDYTNTLALHGWQTTGRWSGTQTDRGLCPSVPVARA